MSKLIGVIVTAVALVMAIACGGSSSSSDTTATTGTVQGKVESSGIDSGSVSTIAVGLFDSSSATTLSNASYKTTLISPTADEADYTYTISDVANGTYVVKTYKVDGSGTYLGELYSSTVTISAGTQQKARTSDTTKPQMNALTSYVTKKAGTDATAITSLLSDLGLTSLAGVYMDGETIKTSNNEQKTLKSPVASLAISNIAVVSSIISVLTDSTSITKATNVVSAIMTATTTTALSAELANTNTTGGLGGLINLVPTAKQTTIVQRITTVAPTYAENALGITAATSFSSISITTVSVTILETAVYTQALLDPNFLTSTDSTAFEAAITSANTTDIKTDLQDTIDGKATVSSFSLAHDTAFGSTTTSSFTLTTLAPVFKISFTKPAQQSVSGNVSVVLTRSSDSASETLNSSSTDVTAVWVGSQTLYLVVSSSKLTAGSTYSYTISRDSNVSLGTTSATGTINVTNITLTGTTIPVIIPGVSDGMDASSVAFSISVKSGMGVYADSTSTASDYGLVSSVGVLEGSTAWTGTYASSDVSISATPASNTLTAGTVTLDTSAITLTSGKSYTITPVLNLYWAESGAQGSAVSTSDYPASLYVDIK